MTVLRPEAVDDISDIQVFEGAVNRTAVFVCRKQKTPFAYPVPYVVWKGPSRLNQDEALDSILRDVEFRAFKATPVDPQKLSSPWLTVADAALPGILKAGGTNFYQAFTGAYTGGLNGCYWLHVIETLRDGSFLVENLSEAGKNKVESVQVALEPDLVFPLLRGRDLHRWHAVTISHILVPQDPQAGKGFPEADLKRRLPKTYAYLKRFEGDATKPAKGTLRGRALFKQYFRPTDPFYSMYNVGWYTFAPWKVVYKRLSDRMQAAVVPKACVPDKTNLLIPTETEDEAHFVAALLNSSTANLFLRSLAPRVQTIEYMPSDVAQLEIPKLDPINHLHMELACCSRECHDAIASGEIHAIADLEARVDRLSMRFWGLTDAEHAAVTAALADLDGLSEKSIAEEYDDD